MAGVEDANHDARFVSNKRLSLEVEALVGSLFRVLYAEPTHALTHRLQAILKLEHKKSHRFQNYVLLCFLF